MLAYGYSFALKHWVNQKNCALQYNKMLERIEKEMPQSTGRRKRGNSDANNSDDQGSSSNEPENPAVLIVKKLEAERCKVSNLIAVDTKCGENC